MLSERDKKEMLEDGLSIKRREEFDRAEMLKPKISRSLNAYIDFLTAVQKIFPFVHRRQRILDSKNIL